MPCPACRPCPQLPWLPPGSCDCTGEGSHPPPTPCGWEGACEQPQEAPGKGSAASHRPSPQPPEQHFLHFSLLPPSQAPLGGEGGGRCLPPSLPALSQGIRLPGQRGLCQPARPRPPACPGQGLVVGRKGGREEGKALPAALLPPRLLWPQPGSQSAWGWEAKSWERAAVPAASPESLAGQLRGAGGGEGPGPAGQGGRGAAEGSGGGACRRSEGWPGAVAGVPGEAGGRLLPAAAPGGAGATSREAGPQPPPRPPASQPLQRSAAAPAGRAAPVLGGDGGGVCAGPPGWALGRLGLAGVFGGRRAEAAAQLKESEWRP